MGVAFGQEDGCLGLRPRTVCGRGLAAVAWLLFATGIPQRDLVHPGTHTARQELLTLYPQGSSKMSYVSSRLYLLRPTRRS